MRWMKASAFLAFLMLGMACSKKPVGTTPYPLDPSIEAILAKMTTKEKVGQMTQLNIDAVCVGDIYKLEEPHRIDSAKLYKAIVEYGVGSILNCGGHAYPREQWIEIIGTIQRFAQDKSRLGIPIIYGIDAIHGANYVSQSILFPQPLAQAATFNRALVEKAAEITAYESRAAGMTWNFSPVLDVARTPLWSRVFETYGEDPLVCTELGAAAIRGYQQCSTPMAACMKHFLGYSAPRSGKDRTPAWIPNTMLREYFLPPFERAVQQGALTVMINSGEINGVPVHASKEILTDLLRTELKFQGIAVTDWEDVMKLHLNHRVAENLKEATFLAVNAGIDMCMVPNDYNFSDHLLQLVQEGRISEERLNTSVRRILSVKKVLGLLENTHVPKLTDYPKFASDEHKKAALETAAEGITLLENRNNVLPLSKSSKVFLTGPAAHSMSMLNGAWSRTWQGVDTLWDDASMLTIYESFLKKGIDVRYRKGVELNAELDVQQALREASESDAIVVCVGEKPSTEKVGDIHDLTMSATQTNYVLQLIATGKPVIVVLVENRPLIVNAFAEKAAAVVMAYLPGDYGGEALANILFGDQSPSGKLPLTYPRYPNDLLTYDHKYTETVDTGFGNKAFQPQWEFGHGLSYAALEYSNLDVQPSSLEQPWPVAVKCTITNSSSFDVRESVLLFVNDKYATLTPSVKKLRAFEKVKVPANSSVKVHFSLEEKDLMFVNAEGKKIYEPGEWEVQIKQLTQKLMLP
jgi:beta-glucosidase